MQANDSEKNICTRGSFWAASSVYGSGPFFATVLAFGLSIKTFAAASFSRAFHFYIDGFPGMSLLRLGCPGLICSKIWIEKKRMRIFIEMIDLWSLLNLMTLWYDISCREAQDLDRSVFVGAD